MSIDGLLFILNIHYYFPHNILTYLRMAVAPVIDLIIVAISNKNKLRAYRPMSIIYHLIIKGFIDRLHVNIDILVIFIS